MSVHLVPRQISGICKSSALLVEVVATEKDDCCYKRKTTNDQEDDTKSIVPSTNPRVCAEHKPLQHTSTVTESECKSGQHVHGKICLMLFICERKPVATQYVTNDTQNTSTTVSWTTLNG